MQERKRILVAAGIGLVVLALTALGISRLMTPAAGGSDSPGDTSDRQPQLTLTVVDPRNVPADVQAAAQKLKSSRVGYAIVKPDRTYLIVSTGSDSVLVRAEGLRGQPAGKTPSFIDVDFNTRAGGERLLILSVPLTHQAEFQFNLDGVTASLPTLHNPHKLPLAHLTATAGFTVLTPDADQLISTGLVTVEGYARAFEGQFHVTVTSAKGRTLGSQQVSAAAGYPGWGSFSTRITIDTDSLPETGLVIFSEPMTGARLVVPVRFHRPAQLG